MAKEPTTQAYQLAKSRIYAAMSFAAQQRAETIVKVASDDRDLDRAEQFLGYALEWMKNVHARHIRHIG